MPKYKVTKVFIGEAPTKKAEIDRLSVETMEYLSVVEQASGSWKRDLACQLIGKRYQHGGLLGARARSVPSARAMLQYSSGRRRVVAERSDSVITQSFAPNRVR